MVEHFKKNSMLKIKLLLTLLILSNSTFSQKKNVIDTIKFICEYELRFQTDSNNSEKKYSEGMLLLIGNNHSRFVSKNKKDRYRLGIEMIENAVKTGTTLDMRLLPRTQFDFHIYKNFQNNEITTYDEIATDYYVYTENSYYLDWCLEDEKLELMGYTCQKATVNCYGREFIAWFTNEIPISDGPYKFKGLPGLIVKISDTKNHYDFTLKSFSKIETIEYLTLPDEEGHIEVSRKEFRKIQKYTVENLREIAQNLGFQVSEGQMELSMENAKKRNNPIELK